MDKLKEMREAKNIKQVELADALGVTQGTISQWESGISNPSIDKLKKLAAELDCTIDELIGDNNDSH